MLTKAAPERTHISRRMALGNNKNPYADMQSSEPASLTMPSIIYGISTKVDELLY